MKRILAFAIVMQACPAYAQPEVTLALACLGESRFNTATCAAEAWVFVKRAGRNPTPARVERVARRYSAFLKRPPARRAHLLLLRPFGPPPPAWPLSRHWWERWQLRFRELTKMTWGVLNGQVPDPCPEVIHFGGPPHVDPASPRWLRRFRESSCRAFENTRQRGWERR